MENLLQQDIKISPGAIFSLTVTAIILFLIPIIFAVLWKKRCGKSVSFAPLFIGAAGFLVSARVLELGVHMVCIVWDTPISRVINGNTAIYVLYGIFMAGIFEECGRYVVIKFLMKKNKTRENMVMYGIGHGGIEIWAISLMSTVSLLAIAALIQAQGVEEALTFFGVTGTDPESLTSTIAYAANFGVIDSVITILERIAAVIAHISFTVIVAYGIVKEKKEYLPIAILAHAVVDLFPALYQRGAVSILAYELWFCACVILLVVWSRKLYKSMRTL